VINFENNQEHNYATEKIWEPLLCDCLTFYWGCPNLNEYIEENSFIYLDEDVEQLDEVVITASIGKKPKKPTFTTQVWNDKWYTKPAFLLSLVAVVTTGTIIYIIKKTR